MGNGKRIFDKIWRAAGSSGRSLTGKVIISGYYEVIRNNRGGLQRRKQVKLLRKGDILMYKGGSASGHIAILMSNKKKEKSTCHNYNGGRPYTLYSFLIADSSTYMKADDTRRPHGKGVGRGRIYIYLTQMGHLKAVAWHRKLDCPPSDSRNYMIGRL